ncbi:hypothetical protein [Oceanithermus desulfurans]
MGCGSSKRRHHGVSLPAEPSPRPRGADPAARLAELYAAGQIDRDTYLDYKDGLERGILDAAAIERLARGERAETRSEPGLAAELRALTGEVVALKNRISGLAGEGARLQARLDKLGSRAEEALDEQGMDAHELFTEKQEIQERLEAIRSERERLEGLLERLEAARSELEARKAEARIAQTLERLERGTTGGRS